MIIIRNGPLPNDPSREAPERVRKTHKDPETIHRLTKLPIDSKLKMNYEKQLRNANRRERAIGGADNVSDVSSYISIPEEEFEKITKDQPYFDRVKCWLSAHTLSWLADKRKQLRTRTRDSDDTSLIGAIAQPLKRFRANDELNEVDPTNRPFTSFDQAFLDLGLHGYNIPLAFFTNKNIDFLNNNSISFHRTKISHIEGKPQILDLADVTKKMKDSRDAGPVRELDLEHFEWIEATENFYAYQVSLYAEGADAHEPIFYRKHFGFFENQVDSVKLYDLWKDIELEMRQKHQNKRTTFDLFDYRTEWGRVKSRSDALDTATSSTSVSLRSSRFNNTKNQKTKVPVPLVASSAGAWDTRISSTTTLPMDRPSGQPKTDRTFFTRQQEHESAHTGTYFPPARRNAPLPTTYVHSAAVPTQLSNGTPLAESLVPQISNVAAKEPFYPILD
ncbi:hypothetical protein GGU10DRAFT_387504 [Lentinula aff. detonsa]|uniref:Uncharacterized protein n=1 Tax=Lentinula aff. detonsa TaxID=2804958 RepID=A0AA38NLW0_9AGAR|nr:hypothetical protein GGU10DRAFT_387504 [Lentinula aff. detonsa]